MCLFKRKGEVRRIWRVQILHLHFYFGLKISECKIDLALFILYERSYYLLKIGTHNHNSPWITLIKGWLATLTALPFCQTVGCARSQSLYLSDVGVPFSTVQWAQWCLVNVHFSWKDVCYTYYFARESFVLCFRISFYHLQRIGISLSVFLWSLSLPSSLCACVCVSMCLCLCLCLSVSLSLSLLINMLVSLKTTSTKS